MKYMLKIIPLVLLVAIAASCNKVADLASYPNGTAPVLSLSKTTVAPAAPDSNTAVLKLSWTYPAHATDSSNIKYVIEVDKTGNNFASAITRTVLGKLEYDFIAKDLNSILQSLGGAFNTAYDVDVRVTSSYANNNERLTSNILKFNYKIYVTPPKIAPPTSDKLFLVGDASAGGWSNPVPVPSQEFSKIDSVTFAGVFNITGGREYLVLPVNGDWSNKYSVADKTIAGLNAGGDFGFNKNDNFPGPSTSGQYKIVLDFQNGKFTVTPFTGAGSLPDNLYIIGGATPGGWAQPVPEPSQKFTRLNSSEFEVILPLTAGEKYLLLPVNGSWANKYAVADGSLPNLGLGGEIGYNYGQDIPAPPTTGTYKLNVNFAKGKFGQFKTTQQ